MERVKFRKSNRENESKLMPRKNWQLCRIQQKKLCRVDVWFERMCGALQSYGNPFSIIKGHWLMESIKLSKRNFANWLSENDLDDVCASNSTLRRKWNRIRSQTLIFHRTLPSIFHIDCHYWPQSPWTRSDSVLRAGTPITRNFQQQHWRSGLLCGSRQSLPFDNVANQRRSNCQLGARLKVRKINQLSFLFW